MAMTDVDARLLVEAHQAGDERAFTEIARVAYPSLYSSARRRLSDHHAAEDAVQETFARAFRALPRFEGEFRLQAWLHRILVNVCIDEGWRRGREIDLAERVGSMAGEAVADPADLTIVADEHTAVALALAELPDRYRAAVALRYLDDLSYRDIAAATGVSEENARARASRGRAALQRLLGRGMAALVLVFPSLRRGQRGVIRVDPSAAVSSSGVADQVGQLAVTNGAAGPLANLSAHVATQIAQATPVVARLAEASASVGGGRSTMVAGFVGGVAAVMMPVAATSMLESRPAQPPVEVAAAEALVSMMATPATAITITITPAGPRLTGSSTTVSPVTEVVTRPHRPATAPAEPVAAPTNATVVDLAAGDAAAPPVERHGGIVSDELTVVADGSQLRLSGPIGFATAAKDDGPEPGQVGSLSGVLDLEEPAADGTRWVSGELEVVLEDSTHELRLEGRVVEETTADGVTSYGFSGSYRFSGAAELGLDRRGDVSWTLIVAAVDAAGEPSPCSSLRIRLGAQPAPVAGDGP